MRTPMIRNSSSISNSKNDGSSSSCSSICSSSAPVCMIVFGSWPGTSSFISRWRYSLRTDDVKPLLSLIAVVTVVIVMMRVIIIMIP